MSPNPSQAPANSATSIGDPIAWFMAEHRRHREFCDLMRQASTAPTFDGVMVSWLLDFVVKELGAHIADEEELLFPLLRSRALPEDGMDVVLGRLCGEHRKDLARADAVRRHLRNCLRRGARVGASASRRSALLAFAGQELRHLALENAVVLPIARQRLTAADLACLSTRLAARHSEIPTGPQGMEPQA